MLARIIKHGYHRNTVHHSIHGTNNHVNHIPAGLSISIFGNNNHILIDSSIKLFYGNIGIGDIRTPVDNCTIKIGKGCTSNGINMVLCEPDSSIIIGSDCMFSWGIEIWASDSHSIIDCNSRELKNWGRSIEIGNHVWIGMKSCILKNSYIANDCIVGACAVVSGQFKEQHCTLAGNPARIVKKGISWDSKRPCLYQK